MFWDDATAAVNTYPHDYVRLEIVEVDVPGNALNVLEQVNFRVRVTNDGPLNLTGVTVRVKGQNGATVANNGAAAPFVSEIVTGVLPTIGGHVGSALTTGSPLKFKAPARSQASMALVVATIEDWNCDLLHILNGHSDPSPVTPKGTYTSDVVAL